MSSILNDTKKILGIEADYTAFDVDITMHINGVFSTLNQLGIGPEFGFEILDDTAQWEDFLGVDPDMRLNSIKTYIYLRVRLLFDPPTTSYLITSMQDQIRELEWRISTYRESTEWLPGEVVLDGGTASEV
jgi:hypothetical protein